MLHFTFKLSNREFLLSENPINGSLSSFFRESMFT